MKRKYPKPHTRSPQLWMGYNLNADYASNDRFRILYPNGKSEWASASGLAFSGRFSGCAPCWQARAEFPTAKEIIRRMPSFKKRVALMKKYDARYKRKTIFLGNI